MYETNYVAIDILYILFVLWVSNNLYRLKRFYNRETIAALNYEIQQMHFILPFYATQIAHPFLI